MDTEEQKARKFVPGLRPDLRCSIKVLKLNTYVEVLNWAKILAQDEERLNEVTSQKNKGNSKDKNKNKKDNKRKRQL